MPRPRDGSHRRTLCLAAALAAVGPGGLVSAIAALCENPASAPPVRRVTADADPSMEPSLAWNGSGWGVAWSDGARIWFARLDSSGQPLGAPMPVGSAAENARHARLVWTGDGYGVAWDDARGRPSRQDVRFARLDAAGEPVGPDITVSSSSCGALFPTLVWTGTDFGLAWEDCRDADWEIYFARVDGNGAAPPEPRRITASPENSLMPALVWDGLGFGLAWSDLRPLPDNGGNFEILFNRLDAAGVALGPDLRITTAAGSGFWPTLAWNGLDYGLAWHDRRDDPDLLRGRIFVAHLDAAGQPFAPPTPVSGSDRTADTPALAWTGDGFALAWAEASSGFPAESSIRLARLSSGTLLLGEALHITRSSGSAWRPAVTWTGASFGVAWDDDREGNREIYFASVRCDCVDADADGFDSCSDCDDTEPSVHPGSVDLPGDTLDQDCDGTCLCDPRLARRNRGEQVACVARACAALIQSGQVTPWDCAPPVSDPPRGAPPRPRGSRRPR